jgi:hypothetical protein
LEARGYYREFTVHTAGSRDRGPRRIITGDDGELYYSDDHYRSFRRILEQPVDRLANLLSQGQSGVYLLTETRGATAVERLCRLRGVRLFGIDGMAVLTKRRFLAVAARAFNFPNWFGANWDAFEDCMTDLEWAPARAYVVLLENMERFAEHARPDFETALRVLEASAKFWSKEGIPFHVLLSGAQSKRTTPPGISTL